MEPLAAHDARYRQFQKKSICVRLDLPSGTTLSRDKLIYLRHSEGLGDPPSKLDRYLGKVLRRDVSRFSILTPEDVADEPSKVSA